MIWKDDFNYMKDLLPRRVTILLVFHKDLCDAKHVSDVDKFESNLAVLLLGGKMDLSKIDMAVLGGKTDFE